ncbi:MAG TPA: amidohydrolase family protein, partial [Desulfopila sp.]|nr:amidohydrolase family protein [Desulfopila sp.]
MTEPPYCIYTSPLVVPVTAEPIVDGAVVVDNRCIVEVGTGNRLLEKWPQAKRVELSGVLMPPLINCHMHLELATFDDIPRPEEGEPMIVWIASLLERRTGAEDAATTAARVEKARIEQYRSGVALIGDICNSPAGVGSGGEDLPEIYRFYEMIAPTAVRTGEALALLENIPMLTPACAHAPYSTAAELIVALKQRARKNNHVFSLHVAESSAEKEFLQSALGPFRDFLDQRSSWDGTILGGGLFEGSIFYLDSLGVLDDRTLCVHCVHVSEAEIALLAKRRAKVCLCP